MPTPQNISIRIDDELLARIDHNARQAGTTRSEYVLSWLPERYDRTTKTGKTNHDNRQRQPVKV